MYLEHFQLREFPFQLTPNTDFYLETPTYREAFEVLHVALDQGEGFLKVTGEVGTGKTLLCRMLLDDLDDNAHYWTVYLPNPAVTPEQLYDAIATELGVNESKGNLLDAIHVRLFEHAKQDVRVVMLVDEAQSLSFETLEAIRLLGNLESQTHKLLQIVLFGQPELDMRLNSYHLRQLKQRICFSYRLIPWTFQQTRHYLVYRLQKAGYTQPCCFGFLSAFFLWRASGGIPRLMSILAHKSLMLCYGQGYSRVYYFHVLGAIKDTKNPVFSFDPVWMGIASFLLSVNVWILGLKGFL